jgi:hypothetical protein
MASSSGVLAESGFRLLGEILADGKQCREVAGAGTKGRYDQRLPSVSFALGLNVCLIESRILRLSGKYCIFGGGLPDLGHTKLSVVFASICKQT